MCSVLSDSVLLAAALLTAGINSTVFGNEKFEFKINEFQVNSSTMQIYKTSRVHIQYALLIFLFTYIKKIACQ